LGTTKDSPAAVFDGRAERTGDTYPPSQDPMTSVMNGKVLLPAMATVGMIPVLN